MKEISCLAEDLLASQEGLLCSMGYVYDYDDDDNNNNNNF